MVLQLLCAFSGSLCFSLLFNVRRGNLLSASVGGLLAWAVYLVVQNCATESVFLCSLAAAAAVTVYAEIMARRHKLPATVYLVAGGIPLFPGSMLYMTMRYAVESNWDAFFAKGLQTLLAAFGISVGMVCATTVVRTILRARHHVLSDRNAV
jgi:uncharacterized membrane protein YjjB (DUF3815 family)